MIKLSLITESALSISTEAHSALQWSDKALFELIYKDYKAVAKGSRGKVTELINTIIAGNTESTNVQRALKAVAKTAFNYVDMRVITNFDGLEYTNINKLVKLFKYVDKHIPDKSNELRTTVHDVYDSSMSSHRYNNNMAELITQLKEEYKLSEVEGEFILKDYFSLVKAGFSKLTNAQLLELLGMVQSKQDEREQTTLEIEDEESCANLYPVGYEPTEAEVA